MQFIGPDATQRAVERFRRRRDWMIFGSSPMGIKMTAHCARYVGSDVARGTIDAYRVRCSDKAAKILGLAKRGEDVPAMAVVFIPTTWILADQFRELLAQHMGVETPGLPMTNSLYVAPDAPPWCLAVMTTIFGEDDSALDVTKPVEFFKAPPSGEEQGT